MDHDNQMVLDQIARLVHDAGPLKLQAEASVRRALGAPPDAPAQMARISFKKIDDFACSVELSPRDCISANSLLFTMACNLQAELLNRTGLVWPAESPDAREPLMPAPDGWVYPDGEIAANYGEVQYAAERRASESGVLRWWLDSSEHGVIADAEGDLSFTYHDIAADGGELRKIPRRNQRVKYEIAAKDHGVYRAATQVRIASST